MFAKRRVIFSFFGSILASPSLSLCPGDVLFFRKAKISRVRHEGGEREVVVVVVGKNKQGDG